MTFNARAKSYAQKDETFKERPDGEWNKGCGALRVRPHPAKLPIFQKEMTLENSLPKQRKAYSTKESNKSKSV